MVKIEVQNLINRAEIEEQNYNWRKAAVLYEQIAKEELNQNRVESAANIYYKMGKICLRAVRGSENKGDLLSWNKQAVDAFYNAEHLYTKIKNEAIAMECRANAFYALGWISTSYEEGKNDLKKAIKTCLELKKVYLSRKESQNLIRVNLLQLDSIISLLNLCKEPTEFNYYMEISHSLIEKTWLLLEENNNIEFRISLLIDENVIITWNRYTELVYGDKKQEELRKNLLIRCNEVLELVKNCDDFFILGRVYFSIGMHYCMFGSLFVEERFKRLNLLEKGFDLIEKASIFCRTSRNYFDLISCLYLVNYLASLFGRFEYYQKRIFRDVHELQKFSEVFDDTYTIPTQLISRTSFMYYHDFAGRSFLKDDTRKTYAKLGIKYGKEQLEIVTFAPFFPLTYQLLTHLYSHLVNLADEDDPQEEYIQKMFYYAERAEKSAIGYKGGNARSAGFDSIFRANKTMVDIVNNYDEKIQHLNIAIKAQKSNFKYAVEADSVYLAAQIRLGLLYEELGIITTEENPLLDARSLFHEVIKEASEKGYEYYSAACNEYIARLEDRLGNHTTAAEYYDKAEVSHKKSLKAIEYRFLKERVNEKIKYAQAWSLIEKAKADHKKENHFDAKKLYEKACGLLQNLHNYNHEALYFSSWAILEEAEQFSKEEKLEEAISSYKQSEELFENAIMALRLARKLVRKSRELKKLEKVAKVRINYCSARINLEKARILTKKGDHLEAGERFANAATQFKEICKIFKIKREREELEAVYYLCKAWENMEIAEKNEDANKYANSAILFRKASMLFFQSKLKYLAQGNSNFCLALENGCNFDKSHEIKEKTNLYQNVKSLLRNAADSYEKGGFKNGANWALATSTYFDAAWHLIQADKVLEIDKRRKLLDVGISYLKAAADLYGKAGYKTKEKEALERLGRLSKEETILLSALNTIKRPSISRSFEGIIAPSCPIETSQSPRIGEIQMYSQEVSTFLEYDRKAKKYQLVYKDLLQNNPETQKSEYQIAIAQIGISPKNDIMNDLFKEKKSGLLGFKESKINNIMENVNKIIKESHEHGADILIFPEMMIDFNYNQIYNQMLKLANSYQMYLIPGSYHDETTNNNICTVIGPEGILWKQEKHIPAVIHINNKKIEENINVSSYPRKTIVCNTKYGRIAIVICRDFLDMDLRVELKNFEPPVDIIINPAFTPVTADFKAAHFDARRSIYAYCFFANVAEFGDSLIYTPEKERIERKIPAKQEGLIYKDINLFHLRSERKKWEKEKEKEVRFIQSTRK